MVDGRWDPNVSGAPSQEVIALARRLPRGARVLDAGCGSAAANALYLSSQSCHVDAFDNDEAAITAAREAAARGRLQVRFWVDDVRTAEPPGRYDLILCRGVLHFITASERHTSLERLQAGTAPGGLHALAIFDDRVPIPADLTHLVQSVATVAEIEQVYAGWIIERSESTDLHDEHEGGIRHHHSILKVVARKQQDPLNSG